MITDGYSFDDWVERYTEDMLADEYYEELEYERFLEELEFEADSDYDEYDPYIDDLTDKALEGYWYE